MKALVLRRRLVMLAFGAFLLGSALPAQANQPPKAVASVGIDLNTGQPLNQVILYIGPADSGKVFTVAGGGSSDPDGDPLTYRWDCIDPNTGGKCGFVAIQGVPTNQVNFRPNFPAGTWDITLTVDDGNFHTATDTVRVKVLVDMTPPTVTPPDNTTVSATEMGGARGADSADLHKFLFNSAMATDNSTAIFTHLPPQVNGVDVSDGTLFPLGATTVTFRIADNFGNVGTATAELYVVDLQHGDLFVGGGINLGFGGSSGIIYRIRNGQVTVFCESPRNGIDPDYWPPPEYITVDSKGRVAAMTHLHFPDSFKFLRCNQAGQPAEKLATFFGQLADPAWPQPFPNHNVFVIRGLHLERRKRIVIDDSVNGGTPTPVNEESYVFFGGLDTTTNESDRRSYRLNTDSLMWTVGELDPLGIFGNNPYANIPEAYFYSKMESVTIPFLGGFNVTAPVAATYMVAGGTIRRVFRPLSLEVSGTTPLGSFNAGLQVFGGRLELFNEVANDIHQPVVGTGCPQVGQFRTTWHPVRPVLSGFRNVTHNKDHGLVLSSGTGLPAWMKMTLSSNSEALLNHDVTDDQPNMVLNPFNNCAPQPIVDYESLTPQYHQLQDDPVTGLLAIDPHRTANTTDAIYATQVSLNRVVRLSPGFGVTEIAQIPTTSPNMGLQIGAGIGVFPTDIGTVHYTTLIIRIDSPVEVVLSDEHGRRLGAVAGQAVNDFGQWGFDSGPNSHPRFYVINYPQPGSYTVQSIGTGTGLFTVHVYTVDTIKGVSQHISSSGVASPGVMSKHDFTLDANAAISFNNAAPIADAGADQVLTADASGNAVAMLDGSASTDSDGDALSFTWAGPSVFATGAAVQITLPVGQHLLTLTVDDGKGGTAKDTVQITVVSPADITPPVLTLPADITTQATSSSGAIVAYSASALDAVDGPVAVNCAPPSGSLFPVGTTTVNCSATDAAGNSASGGFTVTVHPPTAMGAPQLSVRVAGGGVFNSRVRFYDLEFSNTGTSHARNLSIRRMAFRTLAGDGRVQYVDDLTGPLPLVVGDLLAGASTTVRIYFEVPSTVTQFRVILEGPVSNDAGQTFEFEQALTIVP